MLKTRKSADPFETEPLPKTFYYPSQQKDLTKKERKTCLSPTHKKEDKITSPETEQFIKDIDKLLIHEAPTRENGSGVNDQSSTSPFNESWPSTDRTMQISTPETSETSKDSRITKEESEHEKQLLPDTTLGRFIHRFRNAPPKNRHNRDREYLESGREGEFWWLSPPSNSSTPREATPTERTTPKPTPSLSPMQKKEVREGGNRASPRRATRELLGRMSPLRSPSLEGLDSSTRDLQTRARDLLEKSESTLETSSSDTQILKRKLTSDLPQRADNIEPKPSRRPVTRHKPAPPLLPEEDILYQWRLAHKREKAHERAAIYGAPYQSRAGPAFGIPQSGPVRNLEHQRRGTVPEHLGPNLRTSSAPTYKIASSVQPQGAQIDSRQGSALDKPVPRDEDEQGPLETQQPRAHTTATTQTSVVPIISSTGVPPSSGVPQPSSGTDQVLSDCFTEAAVPSHLHLSCDILPCPHQSALLGVARTEGGAKAPLSTPVVECQGRELQVESGGSGSRNAEPGISRNEMTHSSGQPHGNQKKLAVELPQRQHRIKERGDQVNYRNRGKDESSVHHQERIAMRSENSKEESDTSESSSENDKRKRELCCGKDSREMEHRPRKGRTRKPRPAVSTRGALHLDHVIGEVVSDRLFSTPVSSVGDESDRSFMAAEKDNIPQNTNVELGTLLQDSSEDEFPDDEILKMLRSRARNYAEQLRSVDQLLSREEPGLD